MQGWIKLHRKIQEHWIYKEKRIFSRYEAWLDLIMLANHKNNKVLSGNDLINLSRGSFITSELKLMNRWNWSKTKTRSFLELLESDRMIIKKANRKHTTITICNYSVYHEEVIESKPQTDLKQTVQKLCVDTNKNVKNDKNKKNNIYNQTSTYYQLAVYFYEQIKMNNLDHKEPNYQVWSDQIRKMIELDKRTKEQVRYLMYWVQQDDFEMVNVMSPTKLRSRFDQLIMKVKKQKPNHKVTPVQSKQNYNYGF